MEKKVIRTLNVYYYGVMLLTLVVGFLVNFLVDKGHLSTIDIIDCCSSFLPSIESISKFHNSALGIINSLTNVEKVELLPYHDLGKFKWDEKKLGKWFWESKVDSDLVILKNWVENK